MYFYSSRVRNRVLSVFCFAQNFKGGVEDSIVTASCVIGILIFFIAQGFAATLTLVVNYSTLQRTAVYGMLVTFIAQCFAAVFNSRC